MATLTYTRTISAAHLNRMVAALKPYFGLPADASNATVQAAWEAMVSAQLKGIIKQFERDAAAKTATDTIVDVDLT